MSAAGLLTSHLRPGHPDFLDLPWQHSLANWDDTFPRIESLPVGDSRHAVRFVNYEGRLYALKELPPDLAQKEYSVLREMEELGLPVVHPIGYIRTETHDGPCGVLVTRYLDRSLPYQLIFQSGRLERYRDHLLDAMAILLVQLHLSGVFWGDCSLNNTLFRRDAGALQAYFVDAETSEVQPSIAEGMREHDLEITEENVYGALLDLQAQGTLDANFPVPDVGRYLRERYDRLWDEVCREEIISREEGYRIQERVRSLNALGFSVDEVELATTEGGSMLSYRVLVTDRNFHRNQLATLTGIDAEEGQARQMINEIQEMRATLSQKRNRSVPLSATAFHWLTQLFTPISAQLEKLSSEDVGLVELYCELLEHKWYLSENAAGDVGHESALKDYLRVKEARTEEDHTEEDRREDHTEAPTEED
ncbi:MAG: DUF4032 domain-containing protein [Deltaproteobacteria bacterium]|nr:DUF4032 domain-containing protein [Deltaproteobacteria bacterium]